MFNAEQVDGWELPQPNRKSQVEKNAQIEAFVQAPKADIRHGSIIACYRRKLDYIDMPAPEQFVGTLTSSPTEAYYAVKFHELTHWSGAPHRIDRTFGKRSSGTRTMRSKSWLPNLERRSCVRRNFGIVNEPRPDHAAYVAKLAHHPPTGQSGDLQSGEFGARGSRVSENDSGGQPVIVGVFARTLTPGYAGVISCCGRDAWYRRGYYRGGRTRCVRVASMGQSKEFERFSWLQTAGHRSGLPTPDMEASDHYITLDNVSSQDDQNINKLISLRPKHLDVFWPSMGSCKQLKEMNLYIMR